MATGSLFILPLPAWTAVRHGEAGRGVHVHVVAARCDLETGKSLNIAPPGWEQTYGPLVEACNLEYAWSRPDDPARARVQQPGHRAYLEAAELRAGIAREADPRDVIEAYLVQRVERGLAEDRAGVVAALKEAGFAVPREGTHYVTVLDPARGDRWRLKGALYEHDFQRERLERPAPAPDGGRGPGDDRDRRARAADVWRDVERQRERHATYHRSRYGGAGRADSRAAVARMAPVPGGRAVRLSGHLRRELGADAVAVEPRAAPGREAGDPPARDRAGAADPRTTTGADVGRVAPRGGGRGGGTWCCPGGRWRSRIGPGPCTGNLPSGFRTNEGVV